MTVTTLTRSEFAREFGYVDLNGNPSVRAIAKSLRDAMGRWGLSPQRSLLRHARDQLRAGDVPVDGVPQVLKQLLALGECAEVRIGNESFVAPAEPRWIEIGGGRAALLGPLALPEVTRLQELPADDVVVRVVVNTEETAAMLEAGGARQVSLDEWLHPCGFLRYVALRQGGAVRIDKWTLSRFWEHMNSVLAEEGLLLGPDAECRAVVGAPGGKFGSHTAVCVEGRWREQTPDGVWCAYRRGHGDNRWLPILLSVVGEDRRALDLFDHDEWRWALFARSKALGVAEVVERAEGEERVTWPLPDQLRAAMNIIGVPNGSWRWRVADDTPNLWSLIR